MPVATIADVITQVESVMKGVGGAAREWYVGVSADAAPRLRALGLENHSYTHVVQLDDEKTARAIQAYFLQTGSRLDREGETPGQPQRQLFVYRFPRFPTFQQFLERKAQEDATEGGREQRDEWVAAVGRLNDMIEGWIGEADPKGALEVTRRIYDKREEGLGHYRVIGLDIRLQDDVVRTVPVGGRVAGLIGPRGGPRLRAEGRVDVTDGERKYVLYRLLADGADQWHVQDDRGDLYPLDRDSFAAIFQDLLS